MKSIVSSANLAHADDIRLVAIVVDDDDDDERKISGAEARNRPMCDDSPRVALIGDVGTGRIIGTPATVRLEMMMNVRARSSAVAAKWSMRPPFQDREITTKKWQIE